MKKVRGGGEIVERKKVEGDEVQEQMRKTG